MTSYRGKERTQIKYMQDKKPYKRLKLSSPTYPGLHTKVDAEDYEDLLQYSWYVHKESGAQDTPRYIAEARVNGKYVKMHRYIMKARRNQIVDHINRDPLDNRKSNLRFVTRSQNRHNSIRGKNKAGHKGIYWIEGKKAWRAVIKIKKKVHYIGQFKKKRDAIKAYREYVNKKLKEFAVY